jgi:hypothetical protein
MKKKNLFIQIFTLVLMISITSATYAQFGQLGQIMSTGSDDAEKILTAYLGPYTNGVGAGLSTGWYNTAKPHKLGGFDITVSFNLAMIPTADQSYDANTLELGAGDNNVTVGIDGAESPTAAGKKDPGQEVTYYQNIPLLGDVPMTQFNLPKGTGFAYTPVPMIQAGVGLVKETELNFRYSPDIEWGNGSKIGLWGVGLKHGIKQWIPALKKLPIFDLTLQGGYTKLSSTTELNFQPSFYESLSYVTVIESFDPNYWSNQEMQLDVSNITANLLVSGDFKIICIYGGVGISSSKANLKLIGNYPIPYVENNNIIVSDQNTDEHRDPIDIEIENNDGSVTQPRFNAGFRLKFAVVTLNFDYTYANYSVASAGLGISFR